MKRDAKPTYREMASEHLIVRYSENGRWRVEYRLPRGAVIAVTSISNGEMAMTQIRGMLAEFAQEIAPRKGRKK
jgi:hypothetical protein